MVPVATNGLSDRDLGLLAWLGASQEFVNEYARPALRAADANKAAGSFYTKLLERAALYRRAAVEIVSGDLLTASAGQKATGQQRGSQYSLIGPVHAQQTGVPDSNLVASGGLRSTFTVGNPTNAPATIQLKVRSIDVPANWKMDLSASTPELQPGATQKVTLTLTPMGASVRGQQYRLAVEGYIGRQLIGGVEVQLAAPPQPVEVSLSPPVPAADAAPAVSQTPAPSGSRRNLTLIVTVALLVALTIAVVVFWSWRRLRRSR